MDLIGKDKIYADTGCMSSDQIVNLIGSSKNIGVCLAIYDKSHTQ